MARIASPFSGTLQRDLRGREDGKSRLLVSFKEMVPSLS